MSSSSFFEVCRELALSLILAKNIIYAGKITFADIQCVVRNIGKAHYF